MIVHLSPRNTRLITQACVAEAVQSRNTIRTSSKRPFLVINYVVLHQASSFEKPLVPCKGV